MEALSCPSENNGLLPWVYQMARMVNALHPGHVDEVVSLTATILHYLRYTASYILHYTGCLQPHDVDSAVVSTRWRTSATYPAYPTI